MLGNIAMATNVLMANYTYVNIYIYIYMYTSYPANIHYV